MRVGIITFHRAINSGAILQAYALQKFIKKMGYECDVVDYRCEKLEATYKLIHTPISLKTLLSDILHFPYQKSKVKKFRSFAKKIVPLSSKKYSRQDIATLNNDYGCFVVGSDQVWNRTIVGNDLTYFLDFCPGKKKVSYAASVGSVTLDNEKRNFFASNLCDFKGISVREKSIVNCLKEIIPNEINHNIDPVFLLQKSEWDDLAGSPTEKTPYIFAYCLHETEVYKRAKSKAEELGIKIICVPAGLRCDLKAELRQNLGPQEFLNMIKYADCIVSDSFHAIAFSIIFHKSFIAVRKKQLKELNERIDSLMELLGIREEESGAIVNMQKYMEIDSMISMQRETANQYLQKTIEA